MINKFQEQQPNFEPYQHLAAVFHSSYTIQLPGINIKILIVTPLQKFLVRTLFVSIQEKAAACNQL